MGQKVINGDLNVNGAIQHNGSPIPVLVTNGLSLDSNGVLSLDTSSMQDMLSVVFFDEIVFGNSEEDQAGMFAVCTGQSTEPYEITLSSDVVQQLMLHAVGHEPLTATAYVGDMSFPQLYSLFGNQYICANTSNITVAEAGITLVPYVIILDPMNAKMTAYPWDKFFGSTSGGTGDVSTFDVSLRLDSTANNKDYVNVTTRFIGNEDDFLTSFNDVLSSFGAPAMGSLDDFYTTMQAVYDADQTKISTVFCFLAAGIELPWFITSYYEYQDSDSVEPEVYQLIKTQYIGQAKFIDDTGTTVDLQADLTTRLANGFTIDSTSTKIEKTTIMQGGGAGGSTELKIPCKKIVISSSDETDSGNVNITNAKFEFILTKEMFDILLAKMSTQEQTVTEDNLPAVWTALDKFTRSRYASLLHGSVGTNPLCGDCIIGDSGSSTNVPFQINSPADDAGADAMKFELEGGIYAEFFATSTSGDTLTIEDVEFDLGVKVATGSGSGGETVETEIKPEIYEITTTGGFSAPLHFYLTNGNYEYLKTIAQSQGLTINSIDDMVTAFNNGDAQTRASGLFALGIAKMCADYDGMVLASVEVASETTEQHNAGDVTITFMYLNGTTMTQTCSSSDLLNIEMSVSYVHQTIQTGSGTSVGGSGKLYVIDFDLSTKIPGEGSDAGTVVSSPQHYQMCFYESNVERIKALFANTAYSSIQTVQDLANAMNSGWNGSMTGSEAYTHGFLLLNLLSLCDAMLAVGEFQPFGDFYNRMEWVSKETQQGLGSETSIVTVIRKDLGGGDLDFLALDVNNSATVTEYGTSASGGGSSVDDSDILKNYYETLTFKDSNGNKIAGFTRTLLLKNTDWYYSVWNNSVQNAATTLSITVPTVTNSMTLQTALGLILSAMQQAGASSSIIGLVHQYLVTSLAGMVNNQRIENGGTDSYPIFGAGDITWLLLNADGTFSDVFTQYDFTNAYSVDYSLLEVNVVD